MRGCSSMNPFHIKISHTLFGGALSKAAKRRALSAAVPRAATSQLDQHASAQPMPLNAGPKFYVSTSIHKGSAAVCFRPVLPRWSETQNGNYAISRPGFLLLEFAAAVPGTGTAPGERRYAWDQKQLFRLSPPEVGSLLAAREFGMPDLYHDPHKGQQDEGQIRKVLSFKMLADKTTFSLRLAVTTVGAGRTQNFEVPVTPGEMEMLKVLAQYILPYIVGFNMAAGNLSDAAPLDGDRVDAAGIVPLNAP